MEGYTMPKIKIKDLSGDEKISKEELRMVRGGYVYNPLLLKTQPVRKLTLKPDPRLGAYNAPYFELREAELD
jgi:hypothetical protein